MNLTKRLSLLPLFLAGTVLAQDQTGAASTPATQDSPYSPLIQNAQQVIVYTPTLRDGNMVNSLKMAYNLSIPARVITTRGGLMQQSGHILMLTILGVPVFEVPSNGDKRHFMEIQAKDGWHVYDISQGRPVEKRMIDYLAFNQWFGKVANNLPKYSPELSLRLWAKAFLGENLTVGPSFKVADSTANAKVPSFLNPPTK